MNNVSVLQVFEKAPIELEVLSLLKSNLGSFAAQEVIEAAAVCLSDEMDALQYALDQRDFAKVVRIAASLARVSENVGMAKFSEIAENLKNCARAEDYVAIAALGGRLQRIGQSNVFKVMELADGSFN